MLGGQGDLVSRLIIRIAGVTMWFFVVTSMFTQFPLRPFK